MKCPGKHNFVKDRELHCVPNAEEKIQLITENMKLSSSKNVLHHLPIHNFHVSRSLHMTSSSLVSCISLSILFLQLLLGLSHLVSSGHPDNSLQRGSAIIIRGNAKRHQLGGIQNRYNQAAVVEMEELCTQENCAVSPSRTSSGSTSVNNM